MELSRRAVIPLLAIPAAGQSPEWQRYKDSVTEFDVLRLTNPQWDSLLPANPSRAVDRRGRSVLCASNRSGVWEPWLVDIGGGTSRQIGAVEDLDPASLTFSADDRDALMFSGQRLLAVRLNNGRVQELCGVRDGWKPSGHIAPTDDGTSLFFVETREGAAELRRLRMPKGSPETVLGHSDGILSPTPNPRRAMVFWLTPSGELWVSPFDEPAKRRVDTPPGRVLQAQWAPDGQSILYLLEYADSSQLNAIREQGLDTRSDSLVAKTSQFVSFSRNANASVFIGASRNKAAPTVLVLLRATRREFTLCEHKASDPSAASPIFTPNSQKIIFQSDRHGKPALYMMNVEKLIEKTES